MYRTYKIDVCPGDPLFEYFEKVSVAHTNMYNTGLYVCRQVLTGVSKEADQRQENEKNVLKQIEDALPKMQATRKTGGEYTMPTEKKGALSYPFLNSFFYVTENQDYFADGFPRQCAQQTLKRVCQDMKAFYASLREYKKDPSKFLGRPKIPHYKTSGKGSTFTLTNQTCTIKINASGESELQFPYFNGKKQILPLGQYVQNDWVLKQVTVAPFHGIFHTLIQIDDGETAPIVRAKETGSERICAIDLGVTNFAAITNNIDKPAMLIKGGVVINANQHCTKYVGKLQSAQTRGTTEKLKRTKRIERLLINRENILSDYIHKSARLIMNWCTENQIDTLVVGSNDLWKQNTDIGKNTQKFEQIPFDRFKDTLSYLCAREGILFIEQEESYTSKASFPDKDVIPVYSSGSENKYVFSGRRNGRLYKTGNGLIINADLNGSANIGRKAFPDLFADSSHINLSTPIIFKHPDQGLIRNNI